MATKRRKKWWQMLRGPRGHRGLPGPIGKHMDDEWKETFVTAFGKLEQRVAELERKLGGSQE